MSGEDTRVHPYELVFAHSLFEEEMFPAIREEAEQRGVRTSHPDTFVRLQSVGDVLDRLIPPDPSAGASGAAAAEIAEHGRLLYQAYHFWCHRGVVHPVPLDLARRLLQATSAPDDAPLRPPAPAGYAQLPPNLAWGRIADGVPPEPVDGFFWTMAGAETAAAPPFDRLDVLLALGVRSGRAGFSILSAGDALTDAAAAAPWETEPAREGGHDFENVLPGGELGGLFAITTTAEALKLASRWFRHHAAAAGAAADG